MRLSDIYYFAQGYGRYFLVRLFGWRVLRQHIAEQIVARSMSADRVCARNGRCKICGCHTPALFYADKACDKPCYPKMMGRRKWNLFFFEGGDLDWNFVNGKFYKVKEVYDDGVL